MTLREVIKEILTPHLEAGQALSGIQEIKEAEERLTDRLRFILIWSEPEQSMANTGNRFSLIRHQVKVQVIVRDGDASAESVRAEALAFGRSIRRILKNNPTLVSASFPAGFAVYTEVGDLDEAEPNFSDGIPSHDCMLALTAFYFVNEAAILPASIQSVEAVGVPTIG